MSRPLFDYVVVRPPTPDIRACISTRGLGPYVDVDLALKQHRNYIEVLKNEGIKVIELPELYGFPDAVFIQDTAVVGLASGKALISRFAVAGRRGEEVSIKEFLEGLGLKVFTVEEPATIEGGDVLVTDVGTIFVGITSRTNLHGANTLKKVFKEYEVVPVPTDKVFHLLSAVSYLGNMTLAIVPEYVDVTYFSGFKLIRIPLDEAYAANILYIGDKKVIVPAGYKKTIEILKHEGYTVVEVDISEFSKCDGGVTCLSLPLYSI